MLELIIVWSGDGAGANRGLVLVLELIIIWYGADAGASTNTAISSNIDTDNRISRHNGNSIGNTSLPPFHNHIGSAWHGLVRLARREHGSPREHGSRSQFCAAHKAAAHDVYVCKCVWVYVYVGRYK